MNMVEEKANAKHVEGVRFANMVEEKATAKHVEGVRFANMVHQNVIARYAIRIIILANIMRGRIQSALTGRGVKSSSTVEYVGCSFEKLRKHLASQ